MAKAPGKNPFAKGKKATDKPGAGKGAAKGKKGVNPFAKKKAAGKK